MSDLTFFDDPGINGNYTKIRAKARPVEQIAARKALGKAGSWRRRIFTIVAKSGEYGATSIEIADRLARQTPCPQCDCVHRPPIPVNQIASRLQELRDWGYLMHRKEANQILTRTVDGRTAEVHTITYKGLVEYDSH